MTTKQTTKTFFGIDWAQVDTRGISTTAWYESREERDAALAQRRERGLAAGLSKPAVALIHPFEHEARGKAEIADFESRVR